MMKNSSPNREHFGGYDTPHNSGPLININVFHGSSNFQFHIPSRSTFGGLKQMLELKIGLEPQRQKILFRGQEKEDREYLHEAGVKDNSKVLVLERHVGKEQQSQEMSRSDGTYEVSVKGTNEMLNTELKGSEASTTMMKGQEEMSKASEAIAGVRAEVDKLAQKVAGFEVAVNGGTKIAEKELIESSELLMRQLLKLDSIDADGEARKQRKTEVHRIQNFHETLDDLKARNSRPIADNSNPVVVTTEWEAFDLNEERSYSPSSSSSMRITREWEKFD